jgi:histidyl-tRNA synthetase
MVSIKAPRGVRDILPEESWKWAFVLKTASEVAQDFNYREVHLPIFEQTELFARGVGDTTDIVEKEMYTFEDRGGRSLTLRPELSASMVRAYLENRMDQRSQPVKLWSAGPMFRYERPQKGRYRQFWQLDFEAIGSQDPYVDVEVIALSVELFRRLGMKGLDVVINSVGCPVCRPVHKEALQSFLKPHLSELCPTCQDRYNRNPLRILDCKNPTCRAITDNAPDTISYLCPECKEHFEGLKAGLDALGLHYSIDNRLVRGLDYYTKTAYEVLSGELGAQNAVCGGGRYDNLAEAIGGKHTPGVGFAAGLERIVLTMEQQGCSFGKEPALEVFVVAVGDIERKEALKLMHEFRKAGISADMDFNGKSFRAQLKVANQMGAPIVCILGEEELKAGKVSIKDMETGQQVEVPLEEGVPFVRTKLGE